MNLKSLAKEYRAFGGELAVWMIPYDTIMISIIIDELSKLIPQEQWNSIHNTFALCEALTVDVEQVVDNPSPQAQGFLAYFQARNGNVEHNWQEYTRAFSPAMIGEWWSAYEKTRDRLPQSESRLEPEAGENPDPEASAAVEQP